MRVVSLGPSSPLGSFEAIVTSRVPWSRCLYLSQELTPKCPSSPGAVSPLTCLGFFLTLGGTYTVLLWCGEQHPARQFGPSPAFSPSPRGRAALSQRPVSRSGLFLRSRGSTLWFLSFDSNGSLGAALWVLVLPACLNCSPQLVILK